MVIQDGVALQRLHLPTPKPIAIAPKNNAIAGIIVEIGGSTAETDTICSVRIRTPPGISAVATTLWSAPSANWKFIEYAPSTGMLSTANIVVPFSM
jgi:hypothetical protein